jgi:NAD(P)-dependent dehydrogenase (short-subunit alcohol dehydrogenase family)
MKLAGKVAVVTGGGGGIGRALCRRFASEGARAVVVADLDGAAADVVAAEIGGVGFAVNVARDDEVALLVREVIARFGAVDLFCSNAGIMVEGGPEAVDADWQRIWDINVMGHVFAARAVLPGMVERGSGYLLQTVSAAGLLTLIGSAPYSVTKHAALGFAEWLAITYWDRGIRVSAICPQGVRTGMLLDSDTGPSHLLRPTAVEPEFVAEVVIAGINEERFLILPHAEVGEYFRNKANDYERWLRGMRKLQAGFGN